MRILMKIFIKNLIVTLNKTFVIESVIKYTNYYKYIYFSSKNHMFLPHPRFINDFY